MSAPGELSVSQLNAEQNVPTLRDEKRVDSYMRLVMRQLVRNRAAILGGMILLVIILTTLIGPLFLHQDQSSMNLRERLLPPSWAHPMGTDLLGRDQMTRLILGGRVTLQITFGAVLIAMVFGSAIGVLAGYFGGKTDFFLMRVVDVLMTLPAFLLAIAIVASLGTGTTNVMVAVGAASITSFARVSRASTLTVRNQDYVEAALSTGASVPRLLMRYIFPNILPPLIVQATLMLATGMLTASGLSFLGLGPQPPTPEWGAMLAEGRDYIINAPLLVIFPGLAILITAICFNLLGDGLRDAMDPYLRR